MSMPSQSVLAALQAAVAAAADNSELRLQLAIVQLQAGQADQALANAATVLSDRPDDGAAAEVAGRAAAAVGDGERAERYRRLAAALGFPIDPVDPVGPVEPVGPVGPVDRTGSGPPPVPVPPCPADEPGGSRPAAAPAVPAAPTPAGPDSDRVLAGGIDDGELDEFLRQVLGDVERPAVTLADVGGLDDVKRRLATSFLAPMRNPELRQAFKKSLRGGLLLYGPPGCGKTFLARAVAGELGARFVSVGLADVVDMYYGKAVRNLHDLFAGARRAAPCVLFLDEIDALGQKRANLASHAGRDTVAQLLTELDGLAENNEGVYVLGATNRPWDVDEALRRPGRFDRLMLVLPPDRAARRVILATHLRDRPVAKDVDLAKVAARAERLSGADLRLVCEAATEAAMEASVEAGAIRPITTDQLLAAARATEPSTRPWFESARNYALYANQSGTYDELLAYLRANRL